MPEQCDLLMNCGFFKKYGKTKKLECSNFLKEYCGGFKMNKCRRKQFCEKYGRPPSDDMRPDGHMMNLI
jgi:hypothetical protein